MKPRNHAVLVITSEHFSVADLSAAAAIPPDRSWERGSQRGASPGHGSYGASGIEYESRVDRSLPPAEHLADLVLRLGSRLRAVAALREDLAGKAGGDVRLRCWIYNETEEPPGEFALLPEHLAPLIAVNCELGVNVDFVGDIPETETRAGP